MLYLMQIKNSPGRFLLAIALLSFSADARASHENKSAFQKNSHGIKCETLYERCGIQKSKCKILYDAALASGGQWGMPDARLASKTRGPSKYCFLE